MESIVFLTNCQQTSQLVEQHFQNLIAHTGIENQIDLESSGNDSVELMSALVDTEFDDGLLEMQSPFFEKYSDLVQKFRLSDAYHDHLVDTGIHENSNNYYSSRFLGGVAKRSWSRRGR